MEALLKSFHFSDAGPMSESLVPILLTLALSFLIGLEREEQTKTFYNFGGVRTFPLIGLSGYLLARLTNGQPYAIGLGILVLGALLWLSYRKKLELSASAGMTSEMSGMFTFLMGALIFQGALWESTALAVIVLLLLELKVRLEKLAHKIPHAEIFTLTRFLLISVVILPMLPNQDFTAFHLNPFRTWLIVVAISGLSYIAYVANRLLGTQRSIVLTAIFGGIYSSTSATVMLAKRSKEEGGNLFSGAIIIASGLMYFRLVVLLCIFNWNLAKQLTFVFLGLGTLFSIIGALSIKYRKQKAVSAKNVKNKPRNPLELQAALIFASLFSAMSILSVLVLDSLGSLGIYGLSFLSGLTDVDPFVMSLTQSSGSGISHQVAAQGIVIATASNNVMKAIYAAILGSKDLKKYGFIMMLALAFVSLLALVFI